MTDSSINEGDSVTIKYKVKDNEGLKKVELWRGKSKGNLGPIKTDSVSGKTADGKFTDKPSPAGTYYYGIHVLDKSGNLGYDNGAKPVTVKARDTSKPTVSLSVDDSTINEGDTVTISYKVKDSGGSGLSKVELWKGASKNNLGPIKTDSASSDSKDGKFTDKPSAGVSYYGIHAIDAAGNVGYDNGAQSVTVKARDTTKPTVSLSVGDSTINEGDTVTISYKVKDSGGSGLSKVELWKGASKNNLGPIKTDSASSDSKDGKFTDKPSAGVSYYGIHAIDAAGNVGYDNGAQTVTVTQRDTAKPTVLVSVDRSTITEGDTVTISYRVSDSGGSGLSKVELWKGASKNNLSPIKTDSASGGAKNGQFTDKPAAGTSYYGIHVIDAAGNVGYDNGAQVVTVTPRDTAKPTVLISIDRSTMTEGNTVTISYRASDSGGSGLSKVELWKGASKNNLSPIKTDSASGGAKNGQFTDKPTAGTSYYGIHVIDAAGNVGYDNGAQAVTIKTLDTKLPRDTDKPTVLISVDRSTITEGDTVTISYRVRDSGGSGLSKVELWKGANKSNLAPIKTDSASGDAKDGQFTDKPLAGIYYYGIHVIDATGNVGYDNGAQVVTVKTRVTKLPHDTAKPTVLISVDRPSMNLGDTVTVRYTVQDSGGSGLNRVELWRGTDRNNLGPVPGKMSSLAGKGNGPVVGTITDVPSSAATYYYGIHVLDVDGNVGYDNGAQVVTVNSPDKAKTNVKIDKIIGNQDDVGQPSRAFINAKVKVSNVTKGYFAVDYLNNSTRFQMTLTGSGFGDKQGKGSISFSDNRIKVSKITTWTDKVIIFIPQTTTYDYAFNNVSVIAVTDNGNKATIDTKIVGSIQTRPWGQCTWEVARVRLSQNLAIPPSAFSTNIIIDENYVPRQWDAIVFGNNAHVGIISSSPTLLEEKQKNGDTKITYTFSLQDRNSAWDEDPSKTSTQTYVVLNSSKGTKQVLSRFNRVGAATGCYR
ncbi:MAG: hypothetical protein ACOYL3_21580 [Desulfuromonadaceae bacterium]